MLIKGTSHIVPSSRSRLLILEDSTKVIWKSSPNATNSSAAEVQAHYLSHFLGFDLVPPTVIREIDGIRGTIQLWIEPTVDFSQALQSDLGKQSCFDFLINNYDLAPRHNYVVEPGGRVWSIDNEKAFTASIGSQCSACTRSASVPGDKINWNSYLTQIRYFGCSKASCSMNVKYEAELVDRVFRTNRRGIERFLASDESKPILERLNQINKCDLELTTIQRECLTQRAEVILRLKDHET